MSEQLDHKATVLTEAVFTRVYNTHARQLLRTCFQVLQDSNAAQEVVQDVFTSLWEKRQSRRIEGDIGHYLVRAVRLRSFQYLRNRVAHEAHEANYTRCRAQSEYCTENMVQFRSLSECVRRAVCAMPRQCREVFTLKRDAGLPNREIAAKLALSEKTVENHITRAHKFLKIRLAPLAILLCQVFYFSR
jgi:RNA polymerase sigma-70 factor (ECF subfamily)